MYEFDCCSDYQLCSDNGHCIKDSEACRYAEKLKNGINYYKKGDVKIMQINVNVTVEQLQNIVDAINALSKALESNCGCKVDSVTVEPNVAPTPTETPKKATKATKPKEEPKAPEPTPPLASYLSCFDLGEDPTPPPKEYTYDDVRTALTNLGATQKDGQSMIATILGVYFANGETIMLKNIDKKHYPEIMTKAEAYLNG
jgi:hypothetical protein